MVFGGFSPDALPAASKIPNAKVTADGGVRGGRKVPLKANADLAAQSSNGKPKTGVVQPQAESGVAGLCRDLWYVFDYHDGDVPLV